MIKQQCSEILGDFYITYSPTTDYKTLPPFPSLKCERCGQELEIVLGMLNNEKTT